MNHRWPPIRMNSIHQVKVVFVTIISFLFWFFLFLKFLLFGFVDLQFFDFLFFFILLTNAFSFPFPSFFLFVCFNAFTCFTFLPYCFFAYVHFIALAYFTTPCSSFAPICSCLLAYSIPCSSLFITFIYFDVPNLFHESHLLVSWELQAIVQHLFAYLCFLHGYLLFPPNLSFSYLFSLCMWFFQRRVRELEEPTHPSLFSVWS